MLDFIAHFFIVSLSLYIFLNVSLLLELSAAFFHSRLFAGGAVRRFLIAGFFLAALFTFFY